MNKGLRIWIMKLMSFSSDSKQRSTETFSTASSSVDTGIDGRSTGVDDAHQATAGIDWIQSTSK